MGRDVTRYLLRGAFVLIWMYALCGATIGTAAIVAFQQLSLWILLLALSVWLLIRWQNRWRWSATPLDVPLLLWIAAFGLSLLANVDVWRRIAIGLWYAGVYVGVWYVLWNILTNRALSHSFLIDILMIGGTVVLMFGCLQVVIWAHTNLPDILAGLRAFQLPRPSSTLGNPNAFGTALAILLPFALMRLIRPRNPLERHIMFIYVALTLFLLLMTYSRGAWLGAVLGIGVFVLLNMDMHNLLRPVSWQTWLARQPRRNRLRGLIAVVGVLSIVGVSLALFAISFSQGGRGIELRTDIWNAALANFARQPLTGTGLFTFGRSLMAVYSIPPMNPHSHAHSLAFHVLAELGLVGFCALSLTVFFFARALRRNWLRATLRMKSLYAGAAGSAAAFVGHHLLDTTTLTPAIAFMALFVLVLATHPPEAVPVATRLRRAQLAGVILLCVSLVVTGFWSSAVYARYSTVMIAALSDKAYAKHALELQVVIDAEPQLAVYQMQQGFLFGLAAAEGDPTALQAGISAYRQFLVLEPYHAVSWANLSALLWQAGEQPEAVSASQRASALAPSVWQFALAAGLYLEQTGQPIQAQAYYQASMIGNVTLLPLWQKSLLRQTIAAQSTPTPLGQVAVLLESGRLEAAQELWAANGFEAFVSPPYLIFKLLFALASQDQSAALEMLERASALSSSKSDAGWLALGEARLALYEGRLDQSAQAVQAGLQLFEPDLTTSEDIYGANFANTQFLRLTMARQYLPQVYYPTIDPLLLYLLNATAVRLNLE